LPKLGVPVVEEADRLTITAGELHGGTVSSHGDHRIAMSLSLLGLITDGVVIEDAECVTKTFPQYWEVIASLGGQVRTDV
jgi:3-phosphoshikimate 1-carboxyvinyltransferase